MSENRLLIVDDDPAMRSMLVEYLRGHGFDVDEADSGAAMRERLQANSPDLVLLDLGLPGEDGLTLARYLREHHDCGIVMVTGTAGTVDRIVGLEVGADDYIAKPFEPRELLARVKSVLRRLQPASNVAQAASRRVRVGRCEIDLAARRLTGHDGSDVPLTAMEFDLLKAFLGHPNQVLTRDQLLNMTRDRDWEPFDRSIDIRITRLRRKIEPDPENPRVIQTVRGAGYMYVPAAAD
jgi:two-component system phosphate regulon response regulator OmpR